MTDYSIILLLMRKALYLLIPHNELKSDLSKSEASQ
ncbi:hypothetical protein SAMN06265377_0933 [Flagellimonas pacifica]|uniref:Uncharacterized protein n=1 Tax=Flagellimonas pacifica TaxID=1247520 RepID=A0A285MH29_9FLAO|nr:hypothetical protein SAMN06265377_0933 [Allomuricauda parva]